MHIAGHSTSSIFLIVVVFISKQCQGWLFPLWRSTTCFYTPPVGCFPVSAPFTNTFGIAPQAPGDIPTTLRLQRHGAGPINITLDTGVPAIRHHIDMTRKSVFIVHGYTESDRMEWVSNMVTQLHVKGDSNVFTVDWSAGAASYNFYQAAANARVAGAVLAIYLQRLESAGMSRSSMHLVGFSLGAHVAGYTGSRLTGIGRITGLDPAGPAFEGTSPRVRLDRSDADLVDVIHTNGGSAIAGIVPTLGTLQPMGHVDFYPNGGRNQPGCPVSVMDRVSAALTTSYRVYRAASIYRRFTLAFLQDLTTEWDDFTNTLACSHLRALDLFTASINSECANSSLQASSYQISWTGRSEWSLCGGANECPKMSYNLDPASVSQSLQGRNSDRTLMVAMQTTESAPFC